MNEEQRKYTVLEIEKYNTKIKSQKFKIAVYSILSTIGIIMIGMGAISLQKIESMTKDDWSKIIVFLFYFGITAYCVKNFITAVAKKANLEGNLDRLEYDLEMSKLNRVLLDQQKTR